jgi:hypothetical protein
MDEADRFSEKHRLGFKDSKFIMKSVKFFYGTSADELTAEDKREEGMDCPATTEYVVLERTGNTEPKMVIDEINKSDKALYEYLGKLVTEDKKKLLLCTEKEGEMKEVSNKMTS